VGRSWDDPHVASAVVNISVLLRLLREPLASGHVVGQVEVVETGERMVVRNVKELVAYLRERAAADTEAMASEEVDP
jgi:hypothetical protein